GYDHREHTRLVGTVAAGAVGRLMEDLRWQSSGWLTPPIPVEELPAPLRNFWPLELIEILPEPAHVLAAKESPEQVAVPQDEQYLLKIARGLRELPTQDKPVRMEVFLARAPAEADRVWHRDLLLAAPESVIVGRIGAIVTVAARPDQAAALAKLPNVITIGLPRPASVGNFLSPGSEVSRESVLRLAGLDRLHAQNHRGQNVRVAIIDTDFRGYQEFLGKQLPSKTRHLDLTAETDSEVLPKPFTRDSALGHGTLCALALALAAPQADLTLIRIDADAPYQLETVARYVHGQPI